jgi:biopolymer transport protein ExbD
MDLPSSAEAFTRPLLVVDLYENGDVAVDGEKVATDEALRARVSRAVEKAGPEVRAILRADKAVPYGRVIHVMDEMKQTGVVRFAFAVAPAP